MRRVLVDYARNRGRSKRAGGERVTLDEAALVTPGADPILLDLDGALNRLAQVDEPARLPTACSRRSAGWRRSA